MYYLLTHRVVKVARAATERYAPRSTNKEDWTVSGPFSSRKLAERSAASALGTHTCLAVLVMSADEMRAGVHRSAHGRELPYDLGETIRRYAQCLPSLAKTEAQP